MPASMKRTFSMSEKRPTTKGKKKRTVTPRVSRARSIRAMSLNYRGMNVHRFCRETLPQTATFNIIPSANYGAMGYMSFENLQMNQLPGITGDLENLFFRYKVDKIVTTLTPLWQQTESIAGSALLASPSLELEITRVNSKYIIGDYPIGATSDAQLTSLAQLEAKTVSRYSGSRPMVLTTINPGVSKTAVLDSSGTEVDTRGTCPWLPFNKLDVPFKHNSVVFGRRLDGLDLTLDWKYSVTHKIYFRCSQVG